MRIPTVASRRFLARAAAFVMVATPALAQKAASRPLSITRITLRNGLVAILNEDHATPLVAMQLWYHIGSKNDKPGREGMAHFCEHTYNLGTPHLDQPLRAFYPTIGGTSPHYGETTEDVTEFNIIVPSNQLETVLWAESDRMASPFSRADSASISGVRAVVGQERSQNIENFPFAVAREIAIRNLYFAGNPYHLTPLPPMADLYNATIGDLTSACLPYYVPNNAVIALSGDFSTATTRRWIEKYFGGIKRGAPARAPVVPAAKPAGERRLVLEDRRATQPRLQIDWVGAAYANPDRLSLLALASSLSLNRFGGPQPPLGRLSKLLVVDRQLATNVRVDNSDLEKGGVFEILVFPRPNASLSTIETLVDSVIADLKVHPITAEELARFQNYNDVSGVTSLQTKFARADTLAHDQVFTGDPLAHVKQAAAIHSLTSADISRVAAKYLTKNRVVLSMVPAGKLELISKPELPHENVTPLSSEGRGARP